MKTFIFTIIFASLLSYASIGYSASIDEINARGALRVCSFSDRLPFSSRSGEARGLQIELAEEIAKELNVGLEITWLKYRFHARKAGCDMMMEAVAKKDDNADKRDIEGAKPLTRASTNIKSIKNLNIGVMRGTWSHMLMQKSKINHRTKFITEAELIKGVADKEVDAAFISSPQYWWFLKNNPGIKLEAVKNFDFTIDVALNVGVLMRGADEKTVTKINNILTKLLNNNTIQDIYAAYGIEYVAPK